MFIVFKRVISIFSLILIGYIANKKGILQDESKKHLINLMLYITAPCMAASSIYMKSLSDEVINPTIQTIIGVTIYFIVLSFISFFIVKALRFKPVNETGVYIVAMTSINNGFMGFPVTKAVFGDDIFYLMVIHNVVSCIYFYGIVPILLKIGRDDVESNFKENIKAMINPAMIGIFIGIVMMLLELRPPKEINEIVLYLSDATIPLSMIIIGVQLGSSKFLQMLKNKYINIVNIVSMFLFPFITFLIVEQCSFLETNVKVVMIFASAFPSAVVPSAIAEQQGIKTNTLAEVVSITTLTSLIVIPVCAIFVSAYYGI